VTVPLVIRAILEPLRADPQHVAVLFDVDGTLAPIVRHASDAHVPDSTRTLLIAIAKRYGIVACVSGRRAADARQLVAIGSITYIGNHGCETLVPGAASAAVDGRVAIYADRVAAFAKKADTAAVQQLRVRLEDKGPIAAFHWRGAPDETAALAAVEVIETDARAAGLHTHWGRKVLEVRPPVPIDKGRGIVALLRGQAVQAGLYVGDDRTDTDAFHGLRVVLGDAAVCVAVASDEAPADLLDGADAIVDGPDGVRELLDELVR
jgi:trehalose 6-phosphate phosphatase